MDTTQLLNEVIGLLNTLNQTIGVPQGKSIEEKNVLQTGTSGSDPNKKQASGLSSSESKRIKEIATLFSEVFYNYNKKRTVDTAPQTLITSLNRQQQKVAATAIPPKNDIKANSLVMGLLAFLGGVGALLMGLVNEGPLKGIMKMVAKVGIGGGLKIIIGMAAKFFKPLAKVLKKLPLIGSLISIGFAISRFKSGDITGGVIDLLSALSGLLYFVPGGQILAPVIGIGLDVLNSWLDYKAAQPENIGKSKLNIMGEMAGKVGKWVWDHIEYIPLFGGIKYLGEAWTFFKGGQIKDGLGALGNAMIGFIGGEGLVQGFQMLMGFFDNSKKTDTQKLTPDSSWMSRMSKWIGDKLKSLPYILRKPLEWFGLVDAKGNDTPFYNQLSDSIYEGTTNFTKWFGGLWESITAGVVKGWGDFTGWIGGLWGSVTAKFKEGWGFIMDGIPSVIDDVKNMFIGIKDSIMSLVSKIGGYIKDLLPEFLGGAEDLNADEQARLKASGWSTWDEYKRAGWDYKPKPAPVIVAPANTNVPVASPSVSTINKMEEIGKAQLKFLEKISQAAVYIAQNLPTSSGRGGSNVSISTPPPSQSSTPSVSMKDNRMGYASSPYALA